MSSTQTLNYIELNNATFKVSYHFWINFVLTNTLAAVPHVPSGESGLAVSKSEVVQDNDIFARFCS